MDQSVKEEPISPSLATQMPISESLPTFILPASFSSMPRPLQPSEYAHMGDGKHRKRQLKSSEQLALLEAEFNISPLPNRETRLRLSALTGLSPRQVQIWFQNKRAKVKNQTRHYPAPLEPVGSNQVGMPPVLPTHQQSYYTSTMAPLGEGVVPMTSLVHHGQPQHASYAAAGHQILTPPGYHNGGSTFNNHVGSPLQSEVLDTVRQRVREMCNKGQQHAEACRLAAGGGLSGAIDWEAAVSVLADELNKEIAIIRSKIDHSEGTNWTPCFQFLEAFTSQFLESFFPADYQSAVVNEERHRVEAALFLTWSEAFTKFGSAMDEQHRHAWVDVALALDRRGYLHLPDDEVRRWAVSKRLHDFTQRPLLEHYCSLMAAALYAGLDRKLLDELRDRALQATDPKLHFEVRAGILLFERQYDTLIGEADMRPSSGFLRRHVVGDTVFPANQKQLLVHMRPHYVVNRAEAELRRELCMVMDRLVSRLSGHDTLRLFLVDTATSMPDGITENEMIALYASFEAETQRTTIDTCPAVIAGYSPHYPRPFECIDSERHSLDFRWTADGRPFRDYVAGIEGWLACASAALSVLTHPSSPAGKHVANGRQNGEAQSQFGALCKKLEEQVLARLSVVSTSSTPPERQLPTLLMKLDVMRCGTTWGPLIWIAQKIIQRDLASVARNW